MAVDLLKEAEGFASDLSAWREALHQTPELDLDLPQTSAFVQARLTEMGIPFKTLVNGSCVVATLGSGEPCIMLRADMDGLPVVEDSGVSFASTNGRMHACGHDTHATGLLGAARLLKAHEAELKGTVKLLFQPGEETFNGARAAIKDGALESPKVDVAFGMHIATEYPVGTMVLPTTGKDHPSYAAVYGFQIDVTGKGGHGSTPDACVDPVNVGVQIYLALQEIIARETSPLDQVSLTVGSFVSGSAANIIPGEARLTGTARAIKPEVLAFVRKRVEELAPAVAAAYRAEATVKTIMDVPVVVNDEELSTEAESYIRAALPASTTYVCPPPLTGSEDFTLYGEHVPSAYFRIGGHPEGYPVYPHHNAKIRFDNKELPLAATAYAAVAMGWLEKHGK